MECFQEANTCPKTGSDYVMTYLRTIAAIVVFLPAVIVKAAELLHLSDDTTIVISADEAWEDIEQDILHFRGHFEIQTPSWQLQAHQASIYGKLDDPQRIVADGITAGPPVRFSYQSQIGEDATRTDGEGQHLEYEKERNLLTLNGNAVLTSGRKVMRSNHIEYNLGTEQLNAGRGEGVQVTVDPKEVEN